MRLVFLLIASLLVYAINASARDGDPTAAKNCGILLLGQSYIRDTEVLNKTSFVSGSEEDMLPQVRDEDDASFANLGRITQVKDYDQNSKGRLVLTTSKGAIATISPEIDKSQRYTGRNEQNAPATQMSIDFPFATANAQIQILKTQIESHDTRRTLIATPQTIKVMLRPGFYSELRNSSKALAAEFTGKDEVTAVFESRLRIYDYKMNSVKKEILAQKTFKAASIHSYSGKIVAIDGDELVIFDSAEERRVIGTVAEGVTSVIWGNLGSRFYLRQGSKLSFYDSQGTALGEVELSSTLASMAWDASDAMVALSTPNETMVYNIDTRTSAKIGYRGDQWRRVAWSQDEGILLTLGVDSRDASKWAVQTWNPNTGEELGLSYRLAVKNEDHGYPYITGLRGRMTDGTFRFFILRQNGQFADVVQAMGTRKEDAVSTLTKVATPTGRRTLN
jgi:hypothetical protein